MHSVKTVDRAVLDLDSPTSSGGAVGTETDNEDDENELQRVECGVM